MIRLKSLLTESAADAPTVMSFLMSKGLTAAQASGIAGNLQQESQFNPKADSGTHFGIAQWDKEHRWPVVKDYIKTKRNAVPTTLMGQLEGLYWEAKNRGDWDKIQKTKTPADSVAAWLKYFERSGEKPGELGYDKRVEYANELFKQHSKSGSKSTSTTTTDKKSDSSSETKKTYIVKSGETLGGIANRNNTTVDAIVKKNPGLKADKIAAGQKIFI